MIGKNIAEIRKRRGYTLSELAKMSKISKSYLSNIERNINKNPSLEVMKKIATVLKVDLLTLLKNGSEEDKHLHIEKEWLGFLNDLKELGVEKNQLQEYKTLMEFIKWKNENSKHK
ncbi:helix-turn-helix domain-containing protein [Peribacillus sp. NPDC097198]|uniref:helix-turn-helix domain-containing protein n=1 Tax=Peribacillus sp. NPDC097198 TaxID=3364397 RepID=UPI003812E11F